jgi:hypothetical protein
MFLLVFIHLIIIFSHASPSVIDRLMRGGQCNSRWGSHRMTNFQQKASLMPWCIGALVQCLYLRNFPCINCNEEAAVDVARGGREFFKKNAHETTFFL